MISTFSDNIKEVITKVEKSEDFEIVVYNLEDTPYFSTDKRTINTLTSTLSARHSEEDIKIIYVNKEDFSKLLENKPESTPPIIVVASMFHITYTITHTSSSKEGAEEDLVFIYIQKNEITHTL